MIQAKANQDQHAWSHDSDHSWMFPWFNPHCWPWLPLPLILLWGEQFAPTFIMGEWAVAVDYFCGDRVLSESLRLCQVPPLRPEATSKLASFELKVMLRKMSTMRREVHQVFRSLTGALTLIIWRDNELPPGGRSWLEDQVGGNGGRWGRLRLCNVQLGRCPLRCAKWTTGQS